MNRWEGCFTALLQLAAAPLFLALLLYAILSGAGRKWLFEEDE